MSGSGIRSLSVIGVLVGLSAGSIEAAPKMVISQVWGGGNVTAGTPNTDYVELFNAGDASQDLSGWSLQIASSTATTWTAANKLDLSGSVAPGQYFLVQVGPTGTIGLPLPTPDMTMATSTAAVLTSTSGKAALCNSTTLLTGSGCPFSASVVDFVGYGTTANCREGSSTADNAPAGSTTGTGLTPLRRCEGLLDTDNNANDFRARTPKPRNTSYPFNNGQILEMSGSAAPPSVPQTEESLLSVNVVQCSPATGLTVTADLSAFGLGFAEPFTDNGSGNWSYLLNVGFASPGPYNIDVTANSTSGHTGNVVIALSVIPPPPPNDTCETATEILFLPHFETVDHTTATHDIDVTCNSSTNTQTRFGVWWTYTPSSDCILQLRETSTGNDTVTAVFNGSCGGLNQIHCSDPEASSLYLPGGSQYWILVGMWSPTTVPTTPISVEFDCIQPLPNDECIGAIDISCGNFYTGNLDIASVETDPSIGTTCPDTVEGGANLVQNLRKGVWYRYVGTGDIVTLNLCNGGTNFDTQIAVFTGVCGSLSCFVACDDLGAACTVGPGTPGFKSAVQFTANLGEEYWVLITPFSTAPPVPADFQLEVTCSQPLSNDDCSTPTAITSMPFFDSPANGIAGHDIDVQCNAAAATQTRYGVWYSHTPAADCLLVVSEQSSQNAVIALFQDDCFTELACVDDGTNDTASFQLTANTPYRILVGQQGSTGAPPAVPLLLSFDCLAPTGACCIGQNCTVTTQQDCVNSTGTYQGNWTSCDLTYQQGPTTLNFIDISGSGTLVPSVSGTDDGNSPILPLGFSFTYHDSTYTDCYVNNNGFLSFVPITGLNYQNASIPVAATPNNAVYGLWDDLDSRATACPGGCSVMYETVNISGDLIFIVQWNAVPQYAAGVGVDPSTFQIQLHEGSNRIEVHYLDTAINEHEQITGGTGSTVGVENADGTSAEQFVTPDVTRASLGGGNTALRFQPVSLVDCSGCTLLADMDNSGTRNGKDIAQFTTCFVAGPGVGAGCSCADMDTNNTLNATDITLFAQALIAP